MNYKLLSQGLTTNPYGIVITIFITLFAYGFFPIILAATRKTPITKKKYKILCYGFNFVIMFIFLLIRGGAFNGAPYLLWTFVFSNQGRRLLISNDLIIADDYSSSDKESIVKICFCRKCGEKLADDSNFCRKCGTEIIKITKEELK